MIYTYSVSASRSHDNADAPLAPLTILSLLLLCQCIVAFEKTKQYLMFLNHKALYQTSFKTVVVL